MSELKTNRPDLDPAFPGMDVQKGPLGGQPKMTSYPGLDRWTLGALIVASGLAEQSSDVEIVAHNALLLSAKVLSIREQYQGWMDYLSRNGG